jgi:hypothetical protein
MTPGSHPIPLLLLLVGQRGLSLKRGALIDQHDVLHRFLLVTARWSRIKANDEPGNLDPPYFELVETSFLLDLRPHTASRSYEPEAPGQVLRDPAGVAGRGLR